MIYHHLFEKYKKATKVYASAIGAGHFVTAVVTQQTHTKQLSVCIVMDTKLENAKSALLKAELPQDKIVYCATVAEAQKAVENGCYVYTDCVEVAIQTPIIDIVCEGTGVPEVGAYHCKMALEYKKHIAIISKEMDSAVGPILKKLANEKGLVYTPVDGDQHGLLMQMVEWAREIGLSVISAGKSRDGEFIYDETNQTVSIAADGITVHKDCVATIPPSHKKYFDMIKEGKDNALRYLSKRDEVLKTLPGAGAFDLCELTIMANSTGLKPQTPCTTQATLRITELPIAYCNQKNNGIYKDEGIVDVYTCLRRKDEAGMGGGVFMVVRCDNPYSNYILTTKGQIANYDNSTAVIYRPYHLCGAEVTTTLLCAVLLGMDTGSTVYKPDYDLVKVANCHIKAGETLGNDHDLRMTAMIVPATKKGANNAVPAHMITYNKVKKDILPGQLITYDMLIEPKDSTLWQLRALQEDTIF